MKKFTIAAVAAFALSAGSASAADLPIKAKPIAAPEPPAWDLAFGSAIASDYIFRGVTQSNHKPSVAAYFEPRYNINKDLQLYAGLGGASIAFPNRAAAEIDFYARHPADLRQVRVRFRRLVLLVSGRPVLLRQPTSTPSIARQAPAWRRQPLPNVNAIKTDLSFCEVYGKVNYTVNDNITLGAYVYYSPSVLNSGADGVFFGGTAKYTCAAFANGVQPYISGEVGHWSLGTTDSFYGADPGLPRLPNGIPLPGLHHLERRLRLDLEGVHGRPALHRHRPEQGRLQRLHRRPHRHVQPVGDHRDQLRQRVELVQRALRRPALGRPDGQHQSQVASRKPHPVGRQPKGRRPFLYAYSAAGCRRRFAQPMAGAIALEREPALMERRERRAVADRYDGRSASRSCSSR